MVRKLNVTISLHSPNHEVLEYLQKHTSILDVQKLYQIHLENSRGHDCLGSVSSVRIFTPFLLLLPVFSDLHVVRQVDKSIYIIHPRVVQFLLNMFCPSSGTVSSLIASLGFIPIIDDFVFLILFTILFRFLT